MPRLPSAAALLALAACAGPARAPLGPPTLTAQTSGTDALLIAADAVSDRVVWAVGTGGTVARTTDGGQTWTAQTVPGADTLQFRDVEAWSAREAVALSIGPGAASRVVRTEDGGATWATTFVSDEPEAFYDCLAFFDDAHGLLFSDSVRGQFVVQQTADGGRTWTRVPPGRLPAAAAGEGGFASSGTCLATDGDRAAWIVTGNAARPRVLRTADRGATWAAADVPLAGGEAAGLTSVAVQGRGRLVAVGGALGAPDVAAVPGADALVAVGPGGVAWSADGGAAWAPLADATHWGLAVAPSGRVGWLVGPDGRVTRVTFDR